MADIVDYEDEEFDCDDCGCICGDGDCTCDYMECPECGCGPDDE